MVKSVRLELHGPNRRLLELHLEGLHIDRRWGALEKPPSVYRRQTYDDPDHAQRAFARQIVRATRRGYWIGHHQPDLISGIAARPDEESGYLVYGDWLLERNDARGALIHAGDQERHELFSEHSDQLFPESWKSWTDLCWWNGFVRGAVLTFPDLLWDIAHDAGRTRWLFAHPSMHFVRVIGIVNPMEALSADGGRQHRARLEAVSSDNHGSDRSAAHTNILNWVDYRTEALDDFIRFAPGTGHGFAGGS